MTATLRGARYFLAHTPGLVRHGSKPAREIRNHPQLLDELRRHLRTYDAALAYAPNRAFLGQLPPQDIEHIARPWWGEASLAHGPRWMPYGELMPQEEFLGLLAAMDQFDLIWLTQDFVAGVRKLLETHPFVTAQDLDRLRSGRPPAAIAAACASGRGIPLELANGTLVGCCVQGHEADEALSAPALLENLCALVTATMATRTLLAQVPLDPDSVEYVLGSGEEAIGDRYQRGGGNLAKAVAERCGLAAATGADVKAFCCGPNHALAIAGGLVHAGIFRTAVVVGGCSLPKLGMKAQGHLNHGMPILEDVLAGFAVAVGSDDGLSPIMRLDALGRHTVGAQSSQRAIVEKLVSEPLRQLGLRFDDVDRYATELHNPEITEPAGSGNVPLTNYKMIAALAVFGGELPPTRVPDFIREHGLPGYAPTQGHVASAVPYVAHAIDGMRNGTLQRALFLAKGSLFLGRMTQMSDGLSFLLERNE